MTREELAPELGPADRAASHRRLDLIAQVLAASAGEPEAWRAHLEHAASALPALMKLLPRRVGVAATSDVVPRDLVLDLAETIYALQEAQPEDSTAAHLLGHVHREALHLAAPARGLPAPAGPVLVVVPGPEDLAELMRAAINAADQDSAERPAAALMPTLGAMPAADRRSVLAVARHLHALLTTGVLSVSAAPPASTAADAGLDVDAGERGVPSEPGTGAAPR